MQSGLQAGLMWKNLLYRGTAIFLLLFASVDLMNPELCGEELSAIFTASELRLTAQIANGATTSSLTGFHSEGCPKNHSQPNPATTDEECFCCCSHLLPISFFYVTNALDSKPLITDLNNSLLPSSPPRSLYRPPRLS